MWNAQDHDLSKINKGTQFSVFKPSSITNDIFNEIVETMLYIKETGGGDT